jgi:hypothetical protein
MYSAARTPASAGLLVVYAFLGSTAGAQETSRQETQQNQNTPRQNTLIGPLSIGFRTGIVVGNLIDGGSAIDTDSSVVPFRTTEVFSESMSSHMGWGPVVQLYLPRRFALSVDLLHRGVGYDITTAVVDEATDTSDPQIVSEVFETNRAKFWDLVILPRYHFGDPGRPRAYLTSGFSLRSIAKTRGSLTTTDEEGNIEAADQDVQAAHTVIRGLAFGAGIQVEDDVGFKLEIEFRQTLWFRRTFEIDFANSRRHQSEILLGLTF